MILDPTEEEIAEEGACDGGVGGGGSVDGKSAAAAAHRYRPAISDVVELRGLASDVGRSLNGLRGEVVPAAPKDGGESTDARYRVRLFADGRVVAVRAACLGLVLRYDPGRHFVVKVSGADGASRMVQVYRSWAALHQHNGQTHAHGDSPPCAPDPDGTYCVTVEYCDAEASAVRYPREFALRRRLGLGSPPSRVGLVYGLSRDGRRVTRTDFRALEAGLRAAVDFVPLLAERPLPPPPYFIPLTFEARKETFRFCRAGAGARKKGGGVGTIRASCSFPDGNLLAPHWPWRSYPAVVERFASRPAAVRTVEQAVKYHRSKLVNVGANQIRSDARRGNLLSLAQKYGLAQALWEMEEESSVREALAIVQELLDVVLEVDSKDEYGLRNFALDLSLEVGQWDDATALLAKFPSDEVPETAIWTAVLIYFKSRGPESKYTRKALERAVMFNKSVYPLLVGDRILEEGELERCRSKDFKYSKVNGRWFGSPDNAPLYVHNFGRYFLQDPDIVPWLRSQKEALQPIMESGNTMEQNFAAAADGDIGVKEKGLMGTISKLDANKVCCANCGSVGDLLQCSRCQGRAAYCGRQCQLDHWKEHKLACRKNRNKEKKPATAKLAQNDEHVGDPSWNRLNAETRKNLLAFHQDNGWKYWQVTAETPAMLNHPCYSFLTAHPDMRFSAHATAPPHSFRMSYRDPSDSNVHGKIFQPGQAPFLMLREDMGLPGSEKVPRHNMGKPMEFCLVAEVRYTNLCQMSFKDFYSYQNKGRMFDWPGTEAIETCPGIGERVAPHSKRVYVLAAFQMHGFLMQGDSLNKLTRVIPRIITKEGLDRLWGDVPPGSRSRLASFSGLGSRPGCEVPQELYPDLLRRFAGHNPRKEPKRPPTANQAWEKFHETGRYCAYEKMVD